MSETPDVNHTAELTKSTTRTANPFQDLASSRLAASDPTWLRDVRASALSRFNDLGFPTTAHEEWRFTSVAPIAKTAFLAATDDAPQLTEGDIAPFLPLGVEGSDLRLVFVNGRLSSHLSSLAGVPTGIRVLPLSEAWESCATILRPLLETPAPDHTDAFTHLNTAILEDGVFIHVPRGKTIDRPVHILNVATPTDSPFMTHPRNVIIVDREAQATVIEQYISLGDCAHFTNAVTDVLAGEQSHVAHYLLEEESEQAFNISTLRSRQERGANVASHSVLLGGRIVRNNVNPVLAGENGECLVNGLYLPRNVQHMDSHMRVEHAAAHCDSRQFYTGILDGQSSSVFSGRIIVHPGAQKTDAKQTNRNLLLSDSATADTKPQLEIYADDVKCTHGATIGRLNEQAIFYLRARGVSLDAARSMLIHAFAGEMLERMNVPAIRAYVDRLLLRRLPGGDFLEKLL
jgi:Fe-S cluster assembly protein SufD